MGKTIEQKINLTVEWLQKMVKESNTKGLVVGLSGGIDSAVVGCLIKKAFPKNSLGVILPCKSHSNDEQDAKELAQKIDIKNFTVNLSSTHESLLNEISKHQPVDQLSDANLRARLRMSTLYTFAGVNNYLVVGTDNAAELLTGYFTKYGDGGVDILPIARLTKGEVYEWAKVLGVPKRILNRAPSAGLWEGQTDEDEMGTTYDIIDRYIMGEDIPIKDKEIIERLNTKTEHKRKMPPMAPSFN